MHLQFPLTAELASLEEEISVRERFAEESAGRRGSMDSKAPKRRRSSFLKAIGAFRDADSNQLVSILKDQKRRGSHWIRTNILGTETHHVVI
jgi:hypothetical protein